MAIVSKADFARMTGKTRGAITNGVRRGYIVPTPDGNIDTDDPTNSMYADRAAIEAGGTSDRSIERRREQPTEAAALPEPEDISADTAADLDEIDLDHPERYINSYGENLEARNKAAQVLQRIAQVRAAEQKRRKEAGELISREAVIQQFSNFDGLLRTNLLTLPRRAAAHITALARTGSQNDIEEHLKDEIASAIEKSVKELMAPDA